MRLRCGVWSLGAFAGVVPLAAQCPDGAPPPCGAARVVVPRVRVDNFSASDTADAYLAAGIAEDLRAALLGSRSVVLVGPRARAGADYVVSAAVRRVPDGVVVAARLERAPGARVLWTQQLRRPTRQIPAIAGEVAAQALTAMGIRTGAGVAATPNTDPAIYDLYLRGRHLLGRRTTAGLVRALALYREAIARDSTSPLGWAGVARVFERSNRWRFYLPGVAPESALAIEVNAAERALELAPRNTDVLVMRGQVALDVDPTTRAGAIRAFREAIAVDSSNVDAWKNLAFSYAETRDLPNARIALQHAAALDPDGSETLAYIANAWFLIRDLDSAAIYADRAVAADPAGLGALSIAGQVAIWTGRLDDAESHFTAADRLGQGDRAAPYGLTRVLVARGDTARARTYLTVAAQAADTLDPSAHVAIGIADAWLAVGETTRAFWWLQKFHPRRDLHYQLHLRGEPGFDGVRADPRFRALLGGQP